MEVIKGGDKMSKSEPEDVISNMPDIVITDILDRLPLQEAVRTCILSRNWTSKWTMLSRLMCDDWFFKYLKKRQDKSNQVRIISNILFNLKGTITKFALRMNDPLEVEDINKWISFLSTKGLKDLTLINRGRKPLKLSADLFSCLDLKHLSVYNCFFEPPPSFQGFPNLLSLNLCAVYTESSDIGEFLSLCHSLETLYLSHLIFTDTEYIFDTAELENLKALTCVLGAGITKCSTIFDFVGSLSNLQKLSFDFSEIVLTEGCAKEMLPMSFPSIKALKLSLIDLDCDIINLSCAFELIKSCPNMRSLDIFTVKDWDNDSTPASCSLEVDYNKMVTLQLRNVDFSACCDASENDLTMIKYLLACSPFLEEFIIDVNDLVDPNDKFIFSKKVLKLQRAYPAVDIILRQF